MINKFSGDGVSDKEGKLHVVSFDVTVSVDLDRDAKIVNKKLFGVGDR